MFCPPWVWMRLSLFNPRWIAVARSQICSGLFGLRKTKILQSRSKKKVGVPAHRLNAEKVLWYFDKHVWNLVLMLMFIDVKWGEETLEVENTGCIRQWQRFGGNEVERGRQKNIYMHLQEMTWISRINKKSLLSILIKWSNSFQWAETVWLYMWGIYFSERTKDCLHQLTLIAFESILMTYFYLVIWLQCHLFDSFSSDDN